MKKMMRAGLLAVFLAMVNFQTMPSAAGATSCESLAKLALGDVTITSAHMVAPGGFTPPTEASGDVPSAQPYSRLPSFCRVAVTLKPTSDSDIKIEVWLPVSGWNGKFQGARLGPYVLPRRSAPTERLRPRRVEDL